MLTYDELVNYLSEGLGRSRSDLEQLGKVEGLLDSAEVLELLLLIEDLGPRLDLETALGVKTIDDVYELYKHYAQSAGQE